MAFLCKLPPSSPFSTTTTTTVSKKSPSLAEEMQKHPGKIIQKLFKDKISKALAL